MLKNAILILTIAIVCTGCEATTVKLGSKVSFENIESLIFYAGEHLSFDELATVPIDDLRAGRKFDGSELVGVFSDMTYAKGVMNKLSGFCILKFKDGREIRMIPTIWCEAVRVLSPKEMKGYYLLSEASTGKLLQLIGPKPIDAHE